jgi:tRNA nucleotidyltransferase (CCA-adding enzyme)
MKSSKDKVQKVVDIITGSGGQAFLVGGCVRDLILHREPNDYDITTNLLPNEIKKIFKKENIPVISIGDGERHLTVVIVIDGYQIEVTTFRSETDYSDGRHPDCVVPAKTIEEDLLRRDFTINAMASKSINVSKDDLIDPHNGLSDIKQQLIRCVGNPKDRFNEDKLRALRAIRFASQLGFKIDLSTFNEIKSVSLDQISKERIQMELIKIYGSKFPCLGIELLKDSGLLKQIIPELLDCVGVDGGDNHNETVWEHSQLTLNAGVPLTKDWRLRMVFSFHDIGKPLCKSEPVIHFYRHEDVGAEMTKSIMKRLKFSNSDIEYVYNLILNHMHTYKMDKSVLTKRAVKNLVRAIGQENIMDMVILNYCDREGNRKRDTIDFRLYVDRYSIWNRWEEIRKQDAALKVTDLKVNGHDMMKIGFTGKQVGEVLKYLLDAVDSDKMKNHKEELLEFALKYRNENFIKVIEEKNETIE